MAAIDPHNIATVWGPFIIGLLGVGGVLFPNQLVVTIITPDDLLATITSLTFTVRGVGQLIGLVIFQNRLVEQVTKYTYQYIVPVCISIGIFDPIAIKSLAGNLTAVPFQVYAREQLTSLSPQNLETLREATVVAFGKSFPLIYYIGLAFGAVACIASVAMGDISQYMDRHIAVVL